MSIPLNGPRKIAWALQHKCELISVCRGLVIPTACFTSQGESNYRYLGSLPEYTQFLWSPWHSQPYIITLIPGLPTSKILFPYFVEKISVFLITFPYPLICSSSDSKQSLWQLLIYSGGTHWLPVETLVDSFGTTGTGSEEEHVLLPLVGERRMNVLVIKEVFEGFKAYNTTNLDWFATQNK